MCWRRPAPAALPPSSSNTDAMSTSMPMLDPVNASGVDEALLVEESFGELALGEAALPPCGVLPEAGVFAAGPLGEVAPGFDGAGAGAFPMVTENCAVLATSTLSLNAETVQV